MEKIVVIGSEDFALGFELVGIQRENISKIEELISSKSDIGILIISSEEFKTLSLKLKNQIERLIKPLVVILSKEDVKGNSLKNQIIKSFGIDLMKS
jgi:vacuolar-type H+-ATPase subunit F/Vma7